MASHLLGGDPAPDGAQIEFDFGGSPARGLPPQPSPGPGAMAASEQVDERATEPPGDGHQSSGPAGSPDGGAAGPWWLGAVCLANGTSVDTVSLVVIHAAGQRDALTPTEWRLLRVLLDAGGEVVSREQLSQRLWGLSRAQTQAVEACISRLRHKLRIGRRQLIVTVRGQGYQLDSGWIIRPEERLRRPG